MLMKKTIDLKSKYKVLNVRDGILRISLNPEMLTRNENKKIASKSQKKDRIVVQGEFLEVFPNDNANSVEKYLAKVFSIKEDVIEAVLLADDRPVKEQFLARLTGTTGRVRVGFELLGRTVDALGALLDSFSETDNESLKKLDKNRLKKFFSITDFYNFNSKYYLGAITAWNAAVQSVSAFAGGTSKFDGTAGCGSLLHYTRYINTLPVGNFSILETAPEWYPMPPGVIRTKIERTVSKGGKSKECLPEYEIKLKDQGNNDLFGQVTYAISSISPITNEFLGAQANLILPKLETLFQSANPPDKVNPAKWQVAFKEVFRVELATDSDTTLSTGNRYWELSNYAKILAPGVAKQASMESDRVMQVLQQNGGGGFFKQLLEGAGLVAGMLEI